MNLMPQLNWVERLALRLLIRSPRTSMVVAKAPDSDEIVWAVNRSDQTAVAYLENMFCVDELEPPSMLLERLYHAPSYGEEQ